MNRLVDVEVKDLSISYGDKQIIKSISFDVMQGEFLCILGPSGCGKTTLLKAIIGIPKISSNITINENRRNEGIAYIQQAPSLLPWRNLLQNACLGAEVKNKLNGTIIDRVNEEIKNYDLDTFQNHLPHELSGGMQQRTSIISALESQPCILFCDEPFSAIDFVTRFKLTSLFKKRCKIGNTTTLFVTHNIEEAIFLADRILILSSPPTTIVETIIPGKLENSDDAILARKSLKFNELLQQIWSILNKSNEV